MAAKEVTKKDVEMAGTNTKIEKPLSIAKSELMRKLIDAVNEARLPMVVLEYVVRDFYEEVRVAAAKQYEQDAKQYEDELSKIQIKE